MSSNPLDDIVEEQKSKEVEFISLEDYLKQCKTDSNSYATAAERMLKSIGIPNIVDTSKNPKLSRIFLNT